MVLYWSVSAKAQSEPPIKAGTALINRSPFTEYYPDGKVKNTGTTCAWYDVNGKHVTGMRDKYGIWSDKILDSTYTEYYANGNIKVQASYHLGKREGLYEIYYENGKKKFSCNYENDLEEGLCTEWYSGGELKSKGLMRKGLQEGIYTEWHQNGQLKSMMPYEFGYREGMGTTFHNTGKKSTEGKYHEDKETGPHNLWYPDGSPLATYVFHNAEIFIEKYWSETGEKQIENGKGRRAGFDESRNLYYEETYADGKKNGKAKYYYVSGKLRQKGNYVDDLEDGVWKFYDENGKLTDRAVFEGGLRKSADTPERNAVKNPVKKKTPKS